ncbi:MAG: hypothetical protein NTY01_05270 [Verrucomicrobia bacterium]|nr:hypothetical protein [Verrucomicrobiota bacterium]
MKNLHPRTPNLKQAIAFTLLFILLAVGHCFAAAWEGTDDFSSGISTNNWRFNHNNSGEVRVLGTNGHASFIVPDVLAADTSEALLWHGNPTAAEDWNVEVTGHVSAPSARIQLYALRTDTLLADGVYIVEMYRKAGRGFIVTLGGTRRVIVDATNTLFSLRLLYRSNVARIEAWCDPDATGLRWTMLDAISLAEFSPTMTTSNTFTFAVNVIAPDSMAPISEGQVWADDFRLNAISPPPPALIVAGAQWVSVSVSLHLTWTNNGSRCMLQNAGMVTGSWSTVSTPWTTNAGWVSTFVTNASPAQFYRLRAN